MPACPDYVYQTLARARDIGQWYCGQADAAGVPAMSGGTHEGLLAKGRSS
ncbi:MAG: hypothetical protein HRF47_04265 [Chloroflexota bacterium]|jgi:hypothetical protein